MNPTLKRLFTQLIYLSSAVVASSQTLLTDSNKDFSGIQGYHGWYYGYYNLDADVVPGYDAVRDFEEFPVFLPNSLGWMISDSFYTSISSVAMAPNSGNGENASRTKQEHWVIRRWKSSTTGLVRLKGNLAIHQDMAAWGDGIDGAIMVDGTPIFEKHIAPGDYKGYDYNVVVGVRAGDYIDFAVKDAGDVVSDFTVFTVRIESEPDLLRATSALEVEIPTVRGKSYITEYSNDFIHWKPVGKILIGTGMSEYVLLSPRELGSPLFVRAQVTD